MSVVKNIYNLTTYYNNISSEFNQGKFHKEIDDSSLGSKFISTQSAGNNLIITFNEQLTSGEETILTGLFNNHNPTEEILKDKFISYTFSRNMTTGSSYTRLGTFKFDGSSSARIIDVNYIEILAKKENGSPDYDIRVYDATNNKKICEVKNLSNTGDQVIDMGAITNLPINPAIFEVQARQVGNPKNKNIYLDQVILYVEAIE
tara:strand:- start:52 stop:663 length:612 start_codon:yes stop_codon:yes gene_type:complete